MNVHVLKAQAGMPAIGFVVDPGTGTTLVFHHSLGTWQPIGGIVQGLSTPIPDGFETNTQIVQLLNVRLARAV